MDDKFAAEVSEFDTAEALISDLRVRISDSKRRQVGLLARDRAARAIADLVTIEVPEDLVESEIEQKIRDLDGRLQSQGLDLAGYLEATNQEPSAIRDGFREAAELAARVDLGLRAVAYVEYLDENDERLESYLAAIAKQTGFDVEEVRTRLTGSGRMLDVRADIAKETALDWLLHNAEVVDDAGNPVDRALLEPLELVIPDEVVPVDETIGVDTDRGGGTGLDVGDAEEQEDKEKSA